MSIIYCDIFRPIVTNIADILKNQELKDEKGLRIEGLKAYNIVASNNIHEQANCDINMRDYLVHRIAIDNMVVSNKDLSQYYGNNYNGFI